MAGYELICLASGYALRVGQMWLSTSLERLAGYGLEPMVTPYTVKSQNSTAVTQQPTTNNYHRQMLYTVERLLL
jgi:hypothetical protein